VQDKLYTMLIVKQAFEIVSWFRVMDVFKVTLQPCLRLNQRLSHQHHRPPKREVLQQKRPFTSLFVQSIMRLTSLISSLLPTLALSASLSIIIPSSNVISNPSTLPPSTSASLTTLLETYSAPLSISNSFQFRNVSAGSYLLSIQCPTHAFAPLRVDVLADGTVQAWRTFMGHGWDNKGDVRTIGEGNAIEVRALGGKEYYMERAGCEFFPVSSLIRDGPGFCESKVRSG
jgi:Protein of unknown function (DUF2012)